MTEQENAAADMRVLKELVLNAAEKFRAYRKIFLVWGIIVFVDGIASQLLVNTGLVGFIPLVWLPSVFLGMFISFAFGRAIREKNRINPLLARYLASLWIGGTLVVLSLVAITAIVPLFSLKHLSAVMFPIIGLCSFCSAVLFKSRFGYALSVLFFFALLPAALFPQYALLLQAFLMGGGLMLMGTIKNA